MTIHRESHQKTDEVMDTVKFSNQSKSWTSGIPTDMDPTFHATDTAYSIEDFLKRPILAKEYVWSYEGGIDEVFNPWTEFFENPVVANRIANFRNLRGSLGVKFVLNGNGFYYGKLMVSTQPLFTHDQRTVMRPGNDDDNVEASQRPHAFIDANNSEGCELELPFFYYKNALSIPAGDWRKMGLVNISTFSDCVLRHASDSTEPLKVSVYVYGKDIKLSTPTSQLGPIVPQGEEYGTISAPAHTIANFAGHLAKAPMIGPFARATQMVSSAVGGVAQLFGYSRPRDLAPRIQTIHRTAGEMAVTNAPSQCVSLALDAKKEVTIDPRVTGRTGEDEMAFVDIVKNECYLTSIPWSAGDSVDTHLATIDVSPIQGRVSSNGEIHVAPSAWVALPFQYWKGTMRIRFNVVCSNFHRGRLKLVWDPDYLRPGVSNMNTNEITIVDITNDKDFYIDIGWGQNTTYLPVGMTNNLPSFTPSERTDKSAVANGALSVYVVNELTSPSSVPAPINLLVFTSFLDDFEVAAPRHIPFDVLDVLDTTPVIVPPPPPVYIPPTYVPPDEPEYTTPVGVPEKVLQDPYLMPGPKTKWPNPGVYTTPINTGSLRAYLTDNEVHQFYIPRWDNWTGSKFLLKFTPQNTSWGTGSIPVETTVTIDGQTVLTELLFIEGGVQSTLELFNPVPLPSPAPDDEFVEYTVTINSGGDTFEGYVDEFGVTLPNASADFVTIYGDNITGTAVRDCTTSSHVDGFQMTPSGSDPTVFVDLPFIHPKSYVSIVWSQVTAGSVPETSFNDVNYHQMSAFYNPTATARVMSTSVNNHERNNVAPAGGVYVTETNAFRIQAIAYWRDPIQPQGETVQKDVASDENENAPVGESVENFHGEWTMGALANQVHFGEQCTSWRQLAKRYTCLTTSDGTPFTGSYKDMSLSSSGLHHLEYIMSGYLAYRGGLRYKIIGNSGTSNDDRFISVSRTAPGEPDPAQSLSQLKANFAGVNVDDSSIVGASDFEVPYYSLLRFYPARSTSSAQDELEGEKGDMIRMLLPNSAVVNCAAAEDWSCSYFLCTPILVAQA